MDSTKNLSQSGFVAAREPVAGAANSRAGKMNAAVHTDDSGSSQEPDPDHILTRLRSETEVDIKRAMSPGMGLKLLKSFWRLNHFQQSGAKKRRSASQRYGNWP